MDKYNTIIFNLDGTLIDTSKDIINCCNYTAIEMGIGRRTPDNMNKAAGSCTANCLGAVHMPLKTLFMCYYNLGEKRAKEAEELFNLRYAKRNFQKASVYNGIVELLAWLKLNRYKTAVATLETEDYAVKTIVDMKLAVYIDAVYGTVGSGRPTKAQLVNSCISRLPASRMNTLLIGDGISDGECAEEAGVDFIGVTYGQGFMSKSEANRFKNVFIAKRPENIIQFLNTDH